MKRSGTAVAVLTAALVLSIAWPDPQTSARGDRHQDVVAQGDQLRNDLAEATSALNAEKARAVEAEDTARAQLDAVIHERDELRRQLDEARRDIANSSRPIAPTEGPANTTSPLRSLCNAIQTPSADSGAFCRGHYQ